MRIRYKELALGRKRGVGEALAWIRHSEAQEKYQQLSAELKGWWKLFHPFRAWRLYRARHAFTETNRVAANRRFLEKRLADPALAGLNEAQRRAVIVQEDRTLIIAGAGTGKTHTMVEKARDTVRTGIARPDQIAFVTFTRKAAQEIRSRSTDLKGMEIGTLHHLARLVIEMVEGRKPRLSPLAVDDAKRFKRIEIWLAEAVEHDPGLLVDLQTRQQAFEMCMAPAGETPPVPKAPPDGVRVRSMGEARIATTLHLAGIPYRYETEFPTPEEYRTEKGARYFPDFYLPDEAEETPSLYGGIWFEHFANDLNGNLAKRWDEEEPGSTARYARHRRWKEQLHASLGTRFTFTEFGDIQRCDIKRTSFPDFLLKRIADKGRSGMEVSSVWDVRSEIQRLKGEETNTGHWRIAEEIDAWIRTRRQQVKNEGVLDTAMRQWETAEEARALCRLASPVLKRYERYLEETKTVDHEGTILKGWQYVRERAAVPPWTVILVDEYQDVNPAQAAFVHALVRPSDPRCPSTCGRLTAVGDDWQAIFGFQGGDVNLIRNFNDPSDEPEGFSERIELSQTYRFGQLIADTTRHFVTRGNQAIDRKVVGAPGMEPDPRWPSSIVLASSRLIAEGEQLLECQHQEGLTGGVLAALARIKEQCEEADVLVVARKNADLEEPNQEGQQGVGIDRKRIDQAVATSGIRLTYSTIHKAKGTEADFVILLDTGPPRAGDAASNRALEAALKVFRGADTPQEEERRIWYVALTRTRRKVYVIVAADTESHSPFVDELFHNEEGQYDVGEDELAEFLEPMRPLVPCPACHERGRTSAFLVMREGRSGRFAGCTSYSAGPDHHCGYTEWVCEKCQRGLMIRLGNGWARCQNPSCFHEAPLCQCTVPRPMVERRNRKTRELFWGCQRYGMEESCGTTRRMDQSPHLHLQQERSKRGRMSLQ